MMLARARLILQSVGTAEVATLDSIHPRSGRLALEHIFRDRIEALTFAQDYIARRHADGAEKSPELGV
jgi:hypothetical protein